ncbi:hypothetical protein ACFFRR_001919 [Megaselia abdita]
MSTTELQEALNEFKSFYDSYENGSRISTEFINNLIIPYSDLLFKDKNVSSVEKIMIQNLANFAFNQVYKDNRGEGSQPDQSKRPPTTFAGNPANWDFSRPGINVLEPSRLQKLVGSRDIKLKAVLERARKNLDKSTNPFRLNDAKYVFDDSDPEQRFQNERERMIKDSDIEALKNQFPETFGSLNHQPTAVTEKRMVSYPQTLLLPTGSQNLQSNKETIPTRQSEPLPQSSDNLFIFTADNSLPIIMNPNFQRSPDGLPTPMDFIQSSITTMNLNAEQEQAAPVLPPPDEDIGDPYRLSPETAPRKRTMRFVEKPSLFQGKKIEKFLKIERVPVPRNLVEPYLEYCEESYASKEPYTLSETELAALISCMNADSDDSDTDLNPDQRPHIEILNVDVIPPLGPEVMSNIMTGSLPRNEERQLNRDVLNQPSTLPSVVGLTPMVLEPQVDLGSFQLPLHATEEINPMVEPAIRNLTLQPLSQIEETVPDPTQLDGAMGNTATELVTQPTLDPVPEAYVMEDLHRNWYEILRTRDESMGYIPPTPELPKKRKNRRPRVRPLSPVFGTPPRRGYRESRQPLHYSNPASALEDQPLIQPPLDMETYLEGSFMTTLQIPAADVNISKDFEIMSKIKSFEKRWMDKIAKGHSMPSWWEQREKYFLGMVQRVNDVKDINIYPVADPKKLKVADGEAIKNFMNCLIEQGSMKISNTSDTYKEVIEEAIKVGLCVKEGDYVKLRK